MKLLPLDEALALVLAEVAPRSERVPLAEAGGLRLAADVRADRDLPPFDRSTLDGYALCAGDPALAAGEPLAVIETVYAGARPRRRVRPGCATLVMTGAPVPAGADAVLRREDARPLGEGEFVLPLAAPAAGTGIHARGGDARRGDVVLAAGTAITPSVVAVLASTGEALPTVMARPRVHIAVTGDEIRPASTRRLPPAAIRNSNGPTLAALVRQYGGGPVETGTAGDDESALSTLARRALEGADIALFTGGVSAGDRDLVPGVLEGLGVEKRFHRVDLRPGKPVWFGMHRSTLVFGLPGNPVSTQVVFHLLVAPALRALRGEAPGPHLEPARLDGGTPRARGRAAWLPGSLRRDERGGLRVRLLPWNGSGDFAGFAPAAALVFRPRGAPAVRDGGRVSVLRLDRECPLA